MWADRKKFVLQCVLRWQQTLSPSSLRLAAAFNGPGAPMALSVIEQLPTSNGLPLFWWLLTVCPRKVFSFQLWTLLLPRTLQMHSFPVFSKHGIPLHASSDRGLEFASHFFRSLAPSFQCAYTSRQATTPQPTVGWNGSTAPWNSTFVPIATTNNTTGPRSAC